MSNTEIQENSGISCKGKKLGKNCKSGLGNITIPPFNPENTSLTSAYPPNNQKLVMACACMARALADVAHHEMQIWLQCDSGHE